MTPGEVRELTVWQLARMAECADPDSADPMSPGADWLDTVRRDALDMFDPADADQDNAFETADSLVPIYNHNRWVIFTDLAAWQEDIDFGMAEDMTHAAGIALLQIAERLICEVWREMREDVCSECGEDASGGDGYDGLCPSCADKAEAAEVES